MIPGCLVEARLMGWWDGPDPQTQSLRVWQHDKPTGHVQDWTNLALSHHECKSHYSACDGLLIYVPLRMWIFCIFIPLLANLLEMCLFSDSQRSPCRQPHTNHNKVKDFIVETSGNCTQRFCTRACGRRTASEQRGPRAILLTSAVAAMKRD